MAEFALPNEQDAMVHRLYIQRRSRFGFSVPDGNLKEALAGLYSDAVRDQMGQRALILYSEYQSTEYLKGSLEESSAERLDSAVTRRIGTFKRKQYKPARWVEAVRPTSTETEIRLNIVLDSRTHEQLSDSAYDGLNQKKFGRRAITAILTIPDSDIVETPEARRAASRALRDVLWAGDAPDTPANEHTAAKNQTSYVTGIDWSSHILR